MKKIKYILLLLGFGFIACQSDEPKSSTKQGSLAILMDSREGVDIPIIVKSTVAPTVDVDTFHIIIKNADDKQIAQNFDTFEELRQVGMPLLLPIGSYTAEASSGILYDAAFGAPCYRATRSFTIEENTVSQVNLHCTPQSIKVTLKYTENFHSQVDADYTVTVTNGVGTLSFTKDETRSGYFSLQEHPITLHLIGKTKDFGIRVDFAADLKHIDVNNLEQPLEMGDHLIVTLDTEKIQSIELQ